MSYVEYSNICLHGQKKCPATRAMRRYLEDAGIDFIDLEHEDSSADLRAVGTWFRDAEGTDKKFATPCVLTFDKVKWINPDDPSDKYVVTDFAERPDDLPENFAELAIKE